MKLGRKDYTISVKTGTDANKAKFKKECVQGEIYHATDTGFFYIAEVTAGASDATLSKFGASAFANQYSVSFDGTDDYMTTDNSVLNFYNTGGSISAWIKPSSVTGTGTDPFKNRSIINKGNVYLSLNVDESGYPALYFYDGAVREVVATTQVSTSSWMHICATWSTTGSSIYVNGTSEATSSNTPANITSSQTGATVYMGRTPTVWDYFGGLIDELAVFNTELSSSNVSTIYNSGVPSDISALSPVNWWRMGDNDGGTGNTITDQGSGSNNTTLFNSITFSTSVPEYVFNQYSVSFDGSDDYMDIPDSTALETTAFTWSAWFYCTAIDRYNLIVDSATSTQTTNGYILFIRNSNNKIVFGSYSSTDYLDSTTAVTANTWFHVAATHEAGSDKLYVNGSLEASGSASNFNTTDAVNLRIGSSSVYGLYHQGLIDEVAFFNSALSASNITSIYNSGVPNDLTSLSPVGWWRMGENDGGTGTTITDQGSGGNNGTLTNGPTYSTTVPS